MRFWVIGAMNIAMKELTLDVESNAPMCIKVQIHKI